MSEELNSLLSQRDALRIKEAEAYKSNESRAARTRFTFKINDINARIEIERAAMKSKTA